MTVTERFNRIGDRWIMEMLSNGRPSFRNGRRLIVTAPSKEECRRRMKKILS